MSLTPESLRELHHLHRQIANLNERLDRGPKQVKAGEANIKRQEDLLEEVKRTLQRAKVNCDEKQLQLKSNEGRIDDLKSKLISASSNKEYQALKEQIAADEMANSVLSDEILEMFEKLDEHEADLEQAQEKLTKGREELDKTTRRVSDEHTVLAAELDQAKEKLSAAEAKLPGEFRADYDRVVQTRGDEALAPLEGETCGGCNFSVTPQMISEIIMSKPVFCKSCGCLLYQADDA